MWEKGRQKINIKFIQGPFGFGTNEWNKWGDIYLHDCTNCRWYVRPHIKKNPDE